MKRLAYTILFLVYIWREITRKQQPETNGTFLTYLGVLHYLTPQRTLHYIDGQWKSGIYHKPGPGDVFHPDHYRATRWDDARPKR